MIKPGLSAVVMTSLGTTTISSLLVGKLVAKYDVMKSNVFGTTSVIISIESVESGLHTVSSNELFVGIGLDLKFDINNPKESGLISPVFSK
jgi:hypothetical protein